MKCYLLFLFTGCALGLYAQGIRGYVRDTDGNPLEYATVLSVETGSGAVTNADGYYELRLEEPGNYRIVFQFLGYETQVQRLTLGSSFQTVDVRLAEQTLELKEVEIYDGREDPAYSVMRRAIAKADFHRQQVDRYSVRVYLKGTGKFEQVPWYARRELAKEGVDTATAFTSESVSLIEYERPNTFRERVISVYERGDDGGSSPMRYINGSFYQPEVGEVISPLSPRAFGYYRFRLDGYFIDRGYGINKIAVIPRSRGENVFEGHIYIVEDYWSIHSLDLRTYKLGFQFDIRQEYSPVAEKVWMPVTARINVSGKVLGFAFRYFYLASLSDYRIELNPDLPADQFTVIDERSPDAPPHRPAAASDLQERLQQGEPLTRKELRRALRQYEKEDQRSRREQDTLAADVVTNYTYEVDSNATVRDSAYWAVLRPVPLTATEIRGYTRRDSIARQEKLEAARKAAGDTLATQRGRADGKTTLDLSLFGDLFFGESWKLSKGRYLDFAGLAGGAHFNTVEGFSFAPELRYRSSRVAPRQFTLSARPRYGLAWQRLTWQGEARWQWGGAATRRSLAFEGGRYLFQYNRDEPIHPLLNSFWTLFFERNYLRLFEQAYGRLAWRRQWSEGFAARFGAEWAERRSVRNHSDFVLFDAEDRTYQPNIPDNRELTYPLPPREKALVIEGEVEWRPWQKYQLRNGERQAIKNSSPTFTLYYRKGIPGLAGSQTDYDLLDMTYRHRFAWGARGLFDLRLNAGYFLNDQYVGFADYKHFPGNRLLLSNSDPVASFRLLPYYEHSTRDRYLAAHVHYQFRKLLLSRIWEIQLLGWKENIFVNYLATPSSRNYFELGYSIDNIFRIFRIEFATAFRDGRYYDFGPRIGIASNLGGGLFGD